MYRIPALLSFVGYDVVSCYHCIITLRRVVIGFYLWYDTNSPRAVLTAAPLKTRPRSLVLVLGRNIALDTEIAPCSTIVLTASEQL